MRLFMHNMKGMLALCFTLYLKKIGVMKLFLWLYKVRILGKTHTWQVWGYLSLIVWCEKTSQKQLLHMWDGNPLITKVLAMLTKCVNNSWKQILSIGVNKWMHEKSLHTNKEPNDYRLIINEGKLEDLWNFTHTMFEIFHIEYRV